MWVRGLKIVLTIFLPAFFLWLFFRDIDPAQLAESIRNVGAGWWLLVLAAFIQVVHVFLRAARWRLFLGPLKKEIGYYNLIATISIGYMVTMLLPGRIGEVLRPVMLAGRERISKSGALATILLERLMDGVGVASLLAIYLIFFFESPGGAGRQEATGISTGWGLLMGGGLILSFPALWVLVHFRARVVSLMGRILPEEGKVGKAVHGIFHGIIDGFEVLRGGRALVAAWAYTFIIWGVIAFSIWFSLLAFDIEIPVMGSFLMLAALVFGIAIPTQGGVGTYEYFGQEALRRFFGIDPSTAGAAMIVLHIFAIGPVILMGLYFVWREGLTFSGLKEEARGVRQEDVPAGASPAAEGES